jgi:predicted glycosyltransferase
VSKTNFFKKFDLPKNSVLITIASSIVDEIDFRLDQLVENLIEMNSNIYVFRRYHPSKKFTHSKLANARIISSTKSLNIIDFLGKSRFTITTGSQLAFEALYLGSEPLIFEPKGIFNSTEFTYFYKNFSIFEQEGNLIAYIFKNMYVRKYRLNNSQKHFLKKLNLSKNTREFHYEYPKLFY